MGLPQRVPRDPTANPRYMAVVLLHCHHLRCDLYRRHICVLFPTLSASA